MCFFRRDFVILNDSLVRATRGNPRNMYPVWGTSNLEIVAWLFRRNGLIFVVWKAAFVW